MQFLHDAVFGELNTKNEPKTHIHQLLWIPASRPYYKAGGIFEEEASRGFSKFLIFSSWEMVPRMIAVMMSYYAERYTLGSYRKQRGGFTYKTSQKSKTKRVYEKKVEDFFLEYPCRKLASLYTPSSHLDWTLAELRNHLRALIEDALQEIGVSSFDAAARNSAEQVSEIMRRLDGEQIEVPDAIHPNTIRILVDCAIDPTYIYNSALRTYGFLQVDPRISIASAILYSARQWQERPERMKTEVEDVANDAQEVANDRPFCEFPRALGYKFPDECHLDVNLAEREYIRDHMLATPQVRASLLGYLLEHDTIDISGGFSALDRDELNACERFSGNDALSLWHAYP